MTDLPALLDRCHRGDELAWEALVRGFEARVYGMALHLLRDPDEARDLAQEVFIRVFRQMDREIPATHFVPWLLRLTRNAGVDRLRRKRVRSEIDGPSTVDVAEPVSGAANPEEQSIRNARRALVWRALDRIGVAGREILVLQEIEGLGVTEIADLLALPSGTVKSRAHRARLELARAVLELDPSYGS